MTAAVGAATAVTTTEGVGGSITTEGILAALEDAATAIAGAAELAGMSILMVLTLSGDSRQVKEESKAIPQTAVKTETEDCKTTQDTSSDKPFSDVPKLKDKTASEIRRDLKKSGFKKSQSSRARKIKAGESNSPDTGDYRTDRSEVWTRPRPDGKTEVVRIDDSGHDVPDDWSGSDPHAHKELVDGERTPDMRAPKDKVQKFDDENEPISNCDPDLHDKSHIPIKQKPY